MPILALKKFGPDISWKYKIMAKAADFLLMRRTLFEHLEYRGVRTYLWVLNSDEDFDRAFKQLNVSGVMTDCPTLLSKWLRSNAIDANGASEKRLFNKDE